MPHEEIPSSFLAWAFLLLAYSDTVFSQECQNLDGNCPMWARTGECEKNPVFMLPNCAMSCTAATCQRPPCRDEGGCAGWMQESQDECRANPRWMHTHCPVSCGSCPRGGRPQPRVNRPPPVQQRVQPRPQASFAVSNFVPRVQSFNCDGILRRRYDATQGWGFPAILCSNPFFACHCR